MSELSVREGYAPFEGHQTWYRITGELGAGGPPLVVLHGGPGCTHDYVLSFADLATDRAVIHYDQLGNGRSTHLPGRGAEFWTVELFKRELANLLDHLGIAERYCLLGQSWGGMLAAEFAVDQPPGLAALVIANSPASMRTWVAEANRLRRELPAEIEAALTAHEQAGTTDHPDYVAATNAFYARHVCRIVPMPAEVQRTFDAMAADPTVYGTMNGPNEFFVVGSIRDWSIVGRLGRVRAPTLLISGHYDEATQACVQPFADEIPDNRWRIFAQSSHMPHVEERAACMAEVGDFLRARAG